MNSTGLIRIGALLGEAALAFGLAGCTVGPNFVKPEAPASAYLHSVPGAGGEQSFAYGGAVAGDWYRLFHSAALDELVRQALVNNPDLDGARHGLAVSRPRRTSCGPSRALHCPRSMPTARSAAATSTAASSTGR